MAAAKFSTPENKKIHFWGSSGSLIDRALKYKTKPAASSLNEGAFPSQLFRLFNWIK
jgi:hypothetical protein